MARRLSLEEAIEANHPILFDTNILIREFNSRQPVTIRAVPARNRCTSFVSLWEFLRGPEGALLARELRRDRRAWLDELDIRTVLISANASRTFAALVELDAVSPDMEDCLIAAEALARQFAVATSNVADFEVA